MADITGIKNYRLKIILVLHFTLISLSSLGHWEPSAYLFYNSMLILALFWSIHSHDSEEPVQIIVFLVHFLLISMITLGNVQITSYILYNVLFMLSLMWGIDRADSETPLQLAFTINAISIALDVIVLALNFSEDSSDSFSGAMAIIHLLFRPFTTIAMGRIIQDRLGTSGPISNIGDLFPGNRTSYEDIDKTVQPSQSSLGYDFTSAQQI